MKAESLKISIGLLESMRLNNITVLAGLVLFYVLLKRGKATQADFGNRYDASRQQISTLFMSLARRKLLHCDVSSPARGAKITEAFKFYTLTDKGKDVLNQLLKTQ